MPRRYLAQLFGEFEDLGFKDRAVRGWQETNSPAPSPALQGLLHFLGHICGHPLGPQRFFVPEVPGCGVLNGHAHLTLGACPHQGRATGFHTWMRSSPCHWQDINCLVFLHRMSFTR